jgi:hypothetical protein
LPGLLLFLSLVLGLFLEKTLSAFIWLLFGLSETFGWLGLLLSLCLVLAFELLLLGRACLFGLPLHRGCAFPLHSPLFAPAQGPDHQRRQIDGHPRRKPDWFNEREPEPANVEENEGQQDDLPAHAAQCASEQISFGT